MLSFLVAMLMTVVLGHVIMAVPTVVGLDLRLVAAANRGLDGTAASLAKGVDAAFGPLMAALLAGLGTSLCALLRRSLWAGMRTGILVVVPWGMVELLKIVVRRPRPDGEILVLQLVPPPDTFGYPSGHTAVAAALCAAILLSSSAGWGRRVGVVLAVLVVTTTAWSRVALGLHHPTDVLVSTLLVPVLVMQLARLFDALRPLGTADDVNPPDPRCTRGRSEDEA